MKCTKAIIPVAGYGTRRLPITKAIEKCMLPLGNRPVIDYIVRDCARAGITDIYFVVSGDAMQLRKYYSRYNELEKYLQAHDKSEMIERITPPSQVRFHFVEQDMQDGRYGTTIPLWLCSKYVTPDELVLVAMGDDVTYSPEGDSDIQRLVDAGMPAILGIPVPEGDLSAYGVIDQTDDGIFRQIVEKPALGSEPSRMINVSKYVLPGTIMQFAEASVSGKANDKGEYFITDPINSLVASGVDLRVVEAAGKYLDTGSVASWIEANQWLLQHNLADI